MSLCPDYNWMKTKFTYSTLTQTYDRLDGNVGCGTVACRCAKYITGCKLNLLTPHSHKTYGRLDGNMRCRGGQTTTG